MSKALLLNNKIWFSCFSFQDTCNMHLNPSFFPETDRDSLLLKFLGDSFYVSTLQVGFCNLIKRAKDQMNHLWVAESTENSIYSLNFDSPHCSHLKNAAASAQRWAKLSSLVCLSRLSYLVDSICCMFFRCHKFLYLLHFLQTIDKLREKVLLIIGDCKG